MSIISVMKLIRLQNVERFCNLITMYVMSNEAIYEKINEINFAINGKLSRSPNEYGNEILIAKANFLQLF